MQWNKAFGFSKHNKIISIKHIELVDNDEIEEEEAEE